MLVRYFTLFFSCAKTLKSGIYYICGMHLNIKYLAYLRFYKFAVRSSITCLPVLNFLKVFKNWIEYPKCSFSFIFTYWQNLFIFMRVYLTLAQNMHICQYCVQINSFIFSNLVLWICNLEWYCTKWKATVVLFNITGRSYDWYLRFCRQFR